MRWPINTTEGKKFAVSTEMLHSGQVVVTDEEGGQWTPSSITAHLLERYAPEDESE